MHGFITTNTPKHIALPTSTNQLHLEFRLALGLTETKIIAVKRERLAPEGYAKDSCWTLSR